VSISRAVHLIGNVDGTASALGNRHFAFLCRVEVPDSVVVLGVLLQLFRCERGHGEVPVGHSRLAIAAACSKIIPQVSGCRSATYCWRIRLDEQSRALSDAYD